MDRLTAEFLETDAAPLPPQQPSSSPEWVAAKVRLIYSAYRWDDFHDPAGFLAQLGLLFQRYPQAVVDHVTSPQTGIQAKSAKPPVLADIVHALDERVAELASIDRYEAMGTFRRHRPSRRPGPPFGQDFDTLTAKHGRPIGPFESNQMLMRQDPNPLDKTRNLP